MKKSLVAVVMVLFLTVSTAKAFVPLAIPASYWVASAVLHVAAASAGLYYAMKSGNASSVNTSGVVSRPSSVTWVDLTLPTPAVVEKNITTKMTKSQAESISTAKPTTYPNVKAACQTQTNAPMSTTQLNVAGYYPPTLPIGTYITVGSTTYITTGNAMFNQHYAQTSYNGVPYAKPDVLAGSGFILFYTNTSGWWDQWKVLVSTSSPPSPVYSSASDSQFAATLSQNGTSGAVKSLYQAELDAMMQDSSYVPTFTDDTTGLPYVPPSSYNVGTPSQVAAYNANQDAKEKAVAADTAAAASTRAAWLNYSSNKNATTLAGWRSAQATQAGTAATGAANTATQAGNDNVTAPSVPAAYGDGTTPDFSARMSSFITTMKTSTLFSVPSSMMGTIPTGGQSNMNVNFGRFGSYNYDFANMDSAIALFRLLVLFTFSIICLKIITLKGG